MAYQLSTVRSRIQDKLDNTSFDTTKLTQFINDGQRDVLGNKRFTFMEREGDVTTSIGADTLTGTPALLQVPLTLKIYSPSDQARMLTYEEYEDFDARVPNINTVSNGVPSSWRVFNNTLYIFPKADAVYTLKLKYIKKPTELSGDSDVPEIPEEFGELLVLAGYKRALMHDDDFDQAQLIQQEIDDMAINLSNRYIRQAGQAYVMRQPNRHARVWR